MGCSASSGQKLVAKEGFFAEYTLGKKLGQGSFGQVRVATHNTTQEALVVKILDTRKRDEVDDLPVCAIDAEREYRALRECAVWHRIGKSDYCIELLEVFICNGMIYAVMERCQASLLDKLDQMEQWTEMQMITIYRDMLLGIEHVHRKGIVHRDVKPENFLYGLDGTVKLADFGLAAALSWAAPTFPGLAPGLRGISGTVPYMSPEMLANRWYNEKTDVWSYGVCVYLMLVGEFPFGQRTREPVEMKVAVLTGGPPNFEKTLWDESARFAACAKDFCRQLLSRNVKERVTASQALDHDFVCGATLGCGTPLHKAEAAEPSLRWGSEDSTMSLEVKPLVGMVRALGTDFKSKVEPGVAASLDKLLLGQQVALGSPSAALAGGLRKSLSMSQFEEDEGDDVSVWKSSKGSSSSITRPSNTHDGSMTAQSSKVSSTGPWMMRTSSTMSTVSDDEGPTPLPLVDDSKDWAAEAWDEGAWLFDSQGEDTSAAPVLPRPVPRLPACHLTSSAAGGAKTTDTRLAARAA